MNTRDEMADESVAASSWFGFDQLRLTDERNVVIVTIGSADRWDKSHLRRLRQSADLPGLVPVVDADTASDGKPYAVTPAVDAPTLADLLPPSGSEWHNCAAITEAAARATHEAHLRGLFHGALSPDQIFVVDNDVAVAGVGLGLGGEPAADYEHWVAPEVREGGDPTERSDVYSLGKVLEASLGQSIDDVPRSVRRLIMWSGSDTPEARPPSALEFASILAEALGEDRPTYSPAFIPTAEITDLASTASETVAAHTPSTSSGSGRLSGAAAVAGGAGAAALASSLLGGDDPAPLEGAPRPDETPTGTEPGESPDASQHAAAAELAEDAETAGGGTGPQAPEADLVEDATTTSDVAAGGVGLQGTTTTEVSEADIDAAVGEGFDSRQYSNSLDDDEGYDLPAAATTIDLDEVPAGERRSSRAGMVIGGILAVGLGLVAFQLLSSNDDSGVVEGAGTTQTTESATTETTVDEEEGGAATDQTTTPTSEDGATTDGAAVNDTEPTTDTTEGTTSSTEATTASSTETTVATTASTTETTAATTATTVATTASTTETTVATTASTTETTVATTEATTATTAPDVAAPPLVDGPIAADEAAIQILHGIPGVTADVYVDGTALAPGFTAGTIAGPADLSPGTHDVALFAAIDSPPMQASDREDDAVLTETITVGEAPATLVAHFDEAGDPVLSTFEENLSTLAAGQSRIEVRHLAAAPAVQLSIDDEPVDGLLEPGKAASVVLAAGDHTLEATTADGDPVKTATVTVSDGELASISLIGSAADGIDVAVQRYTGLGSAPDGIPTGDSDLLGAGEDATGLYLLAALASLMAAAGGVLMIRRSRRVL